MELMELALDDIHFDEEFNCRGHIDAVDVVDLAKDIERQGLIQPIAVAPYDEKRQLKTGKKYLLIAGYRRYKAHVVLGRKTIPALIKPEMADNVNAQFFNLSENLVRKDLNIVQEARTIKRLIDLGVSRKEIGIRVGFGDGWVQVRDMLLKLPPEIQAEVANGFIGQTSIRDLYTLHINSSKEVLIDYAKKLKDAKISGRTADSVRKPVVKNTKRKRSPQEIFNMMDLVSDTLGYGLTTRVMAWCAGSISDDELYDTIQKIAEDKGVTFNRPSYV